MNEFGEMLYSNVNHISIGLNTLIKRWHLGKPRAQESTKVGKK
jgi:hypothetical protein